MKVFSSLNGSELEGQNTRSTQYRKHHYHKLEAYLGKFPASGGGGAHQALLGAANHAVRADVSADEYVELVRPHIHGSRPVLDSEIMDAWKRAANDYTEGQDWNTETAHGLGRERNRSAQNYEDRKKVCLGVRDLLIENGKRFTQLDLVSASPVPVPKKPEEQARLVLESLYSPEDNLFLGKSQSKVLPGRNLRSVKEYLSSHQFKMGAIPEHIIPNPLSGQLAKTKSGDKDTYRGDNNVAQFKYAVAEFDCLSLEDQIAFWSQVDLPTVALIFSAGKSIHAWIRVDNVVDHQGWDSAVKQNIYDGFLVPMGVDSACKNPSRLSRMPGHFRRGKGRQELLYLAPEGKAVTK